MREFFVSYHHSDQDWAEWLAWALKDAGYTVTLAAWDFLPGSNYVLELQKGLRDAERVLALLSPSYLAADQSNAEWAAVWGQDPASQEARLVPVLIQPCNPDGLLRRLTAIDLIGLDEDAARPRLLQGLQPKAAPAPRRAFPGLRPTAERPAFPADLSALLHRLPMPLAQLLRRTLNCTSAVERHLNAYYLAEVALKLAAGLRIGVWLEKGLDPQSPVARVLEALVLPAPPQWLDFLREVDDALAERRDAALLPLGAHLGRLREARPEWVFVARLAQAMQAEGLVGAAVARAAQEGGLLGFFSLVMAYRSEILGPPRGVSFCKRFAGQLLDALREVLASPVLFGALHLRQARLQVQEGVATLGWSWQNLTGPLSTPTAAETDAAESVTPGHLYFVGPGARVSLYPIAAYQEDELERERVGLLSKVHLRDQKVGGGVSEVLRADYLDYASGQHLSGVDAAEPLTHLLGRLRGTPVSASDLRRAQEASTAATASVEVEDVVGAGAAIGDFEIIDAIGRGGMGIVYRARQRSLNRIVALKVLPPALAADEQMRRRFRKEITALSRCEHPQIIKILASGVDGDRSYFAMEYVDGADLSALGEVLRRFRCEGQRLHEGHLLMALAACAHKEEPQPVEGSGSRPLHLRVAELFLGAAEGLEHLHQQKILHRDIKPANLMLTGDGRRVVIMDLGLARLSDASEATREQSAVLGTLRQLAPERLQGKEADARTDIYGLGASLYELVTGRPLFDGTDEARLRQQILLEEPAPPRRVTSGLPEDLATIISVATAKDPQRRYQSAAALAGDLRAFLAGRPISAVPASRLHRLALLAQRRPTEATLVLLLMLGSLLGGLGWWDWNRVKYSYFANYVEVEGQLRGIGPVRFWEQRHRHETMRFRQQRGHLVKVERINGSGRLTGDEPSWDLVYDESGRVREKVIRDRHGEIVQRQLYLDNPKRVEIKDARNRPKHLSGTEATVRMEDLDQRGYLRQQRFADSYGSARTGAENVAAYDYTRDDRGLVIRQRALGVDGKPQPTKEGVVDVAFRRDAQGNIIEESYFGSDGNRIMKRDGYAVVRRQFDQYDNQVEETYLGLNGQITAHKSSYAGWRSRFDERGNEVERSYFGVDGKPTLHKDGNAGWRSRFDERGNEVETSYFGVNGKSTLLKYGYAGWRSRFDERGNQVERSFFGVDGKLTLHKDGNAGWRSRFDERGNKVETFYFGVDGKPTLHKDGNAGWRSRFDERGNQVETSYFSVDSKPALSNDDSIAGWRARFDDRGNRVEISYFGVDGKPILSKDSIAGWRRRVDDRGNAVEWSLFGVDGKSALHKDGEAGSRSRFDDRSNEVERAYFGVDGKPTLLKKPLQVNLWANLGSGSLPMV